MFSKDVLVSCMEAYCQAGSGAGSLRQAAGSRRMNASGSDVCIQHDFKCQSHEDMQTAVLGQ